MTTQVMNAQYNPSKEEDISYNAWNQFNQLKSSQTTIKPTYRIIHDEVEKEYDEETIVDSAWSKFCEMKGHVQKKPEYKKELKEEEIHEEIDGAWKEFIVNNEKTTVKKPEYVKITKEVNDTEEDTVIDGAWKEFIEINKKPIEKIEYIKVTEDDVNNEDETSEEEYEHSAWNNFKTIESEEKLNKKKPIVYESPKKSERVKIHLADCAWNEFVASDKNLFEKYEKYLERVEDDVIIIDETFAEEESADSSVSIINEGETTIISDSFRKEIEDKDEIKEVKPIENIQIVEKINIQPEEIKIIEETGEEIEIDPVEETKLVVEPVEEVKVIEEIKEIAKPIEEVKVVEENKEAIKPVDEVKVVEENKETAKPVDEIEIVEEVKEVVKPINEIEVVEEVKEVVKPNEEVKVVEEVKEIVQPIEEVKVVEENKPTKKISKKKGKFSKLLKKTKKIIKKIFSHKKDKKSKN